MHIFVGMDLLQTATDWLFIVVKYPVSHLFKKKPTTNLSFM